MLSPFRLVLPSQLPLKELAVGSRTLWSLFTRLAPRVATGSSLLRRDALYIQYTGSIPHACRLSLAPDIYFLWASSSHHLSGTVYFTTVKCQYSQHAKSAHGYTQYKYSTCSSTCSTWTLSRHALAHNEANMTLKRKRSSSELPSSPLSFASAFSSPPSDAASRIDYTPRMGLINPCHLHSRTLKRLRDNRPSQEEIHREYIGSNVPPPTFTLFLLFNRKTNTRV